jgi:hypothetical protein
MAGLVPAIHVLPGATEDVDARHEAGHGGGETAAYLALHSPARYCAMTAS